MAHDANQLHDQAERCRRLARSQTDRDVVDRLHAMAEEFERCADAYESEAMIHPLEERKTDGN